MRDAELKEKINEVYASNYRVYGARKIWRELNRQNLAVARCTVERLMRELGITGAVRGKRVITTIPDEKAERAPDRVDRNFVAAAPNRTWVADFTHVACEVRGRGHRDVRFSPPLMLARVCPGQLTFQMADLGGVFPNQWWFDPGSASAVFVEPPLKWAL